MSLPVFCGSSYCKCFIFLCAVLSLFSLYVIIVSCLLPTMVHGQVVCGLSLFCCSYCKCFIFLCAVLSLFSLYVIIVSCLLPTMVHGQVVCGLSLFCCSHGCAMPLDCDVSGFPLCFDASVFFLPIILLHSALMGANIDHFLGYYLLAFTFYCVGTSGLTVLDRLEVYGY